MPWDIGGLAARESESSGADVCFEPWKPGLKPHLCACSKPASFGVAVETEGHKCLSSAGTKATLLEERCSMADGLVDQRDRRSQDEAKAAPPEEPCGLSAKIDFYTFSKSVDFIFDQF